MNTVDDFRAELLARVQVRASADSNFTLSAFAEVCGELLEEAEELYDFEPCYCRRKGSKNRNVAVDGYTFDDADMSVRIVLAHFSGGQESENLTKTEAKALFGAATSFVEDSVSGYLQKITEESSPEHGLAKDLQARFGSLLRFRFYLVTDRVLSDRVRDWPEGEISGVPAEFHIWDAARFFRAHVSCSGRDELIVSFEGAEGGGLPFLPASVSGDDYTGYLSVIPGALLANVYEEFGSRLLEGNVRAFLSTTVKVNKGIQQTLQKEPEMFFAYNNGIAATASSVEITQTDAGLRITSATDFQIVNGGQTTASLAYARRKAGAELDDVFVQMKLSVVDQVRAGSLIPLIARFSNSQNKVSDADFFANHEFHRRMESISRRLRAPARKGSQLETRWFYERARGQYAVETGRLNQADKNRFELENPRDQIITKEDLAKAENSWKKLPFEVSRGRQKNFLKFAERITGEWESSPDSFNDEYFRAMVTRIMIFRHLERVIPKQSWYDGGYRAQTVTFTIAKLADVIEKQGAGRQFNSHQIWRQQSLSSPLIAQLLLIAKAAFDVITSPEAGVQNVTEWSKKELAWKRLQEKNVPLLTELADELAASEDVAARHRMSKVEAKIDAGVDALKEVFAFGNKNWVRLKQWADEKNAVTPKEVDLLRVAINPKWMPSDRQAQDLIRLLRRLRDEGFGG